MPKRPPRHTFRGSDAPRARALARSERRPKFALGAVVIDPFGDLGVVDSVYADLRAVEDAGLVGNAAAWRRELEIRPKTSVTGIWYGLVYGHGAGVIGELDLRRAPAGSRSQP